MKKTAVQELIDWAISLQYNQQQCIDWIVIKDKAESLLEMEKQQIMNTYIIADSESTQEDSEHNALKFYERTYGNKASNETHQVGYICPQTKKQCKDECCVSAEDCHIQAGIGIIFDCENESKGSDEPKQ
jgi:hypothetical protein